MGNLAEFLNARLDEDEAAALAADPGPWEVGPNSARKGMVYIREEGDLLDSVGLTWREPVFTSQVPNKTRFRQNAAHIARHDPARVLREVAAKRAILAGHPRVETMFAECGTCHESEEGWAGTVPVQWPCATVRILASAWSDHPGYRQEWKL